MAERTEKMSTIIIVTLFLLGWKIFTADLNRQMESRDLSKVDFAKVYKDKTDNFLSMYDIKQNIIRGKYDRR